MRQGYGERNLGMQDSVTAGLNQLSRNLRDVQQALDGKQPGRNGAQNDKTAEALAQVQRLREQLERGSQQQGGEGQQQGRESDQAGGQQPGSQQQAGSERGGYARFGGYGPEIDRRGVQDAMRELSTLRAQLDPNDRELGGYIDGALWNMRHLTGAQAGLLDERISHDAVVSLQRLELELSKRAAQRGEGARTGAPENSPDKYRDAVAEYFKKLSK
jgi:hypothetical protein